MPKINIYVNQGLRDRMLDHDLNWSQIASNAIETAIEIQEKSTVNVQEAAVTRLRAQRETANEKRRAEGRVIGAQWAGAQADYETLEAVAELAEDEFDDGDAAVAALAVAVCGDSDEASQLQVIETLGLEGKKSAPLWLVYGFIEGAAEVFEKV
jgi:hypothetical protein